MELQVQKGCGDDFVELAHDIHDKGLMLRTLLGEVGEADREEESGLRNVVAPDTACCRHLEDGTLQAVVVADADGCSGARVEDCEDLILAEREGRTLAVHMAAAEVVSGGCRNRVQSKIARARVKARRRA